MRELKAKLIGTKSYGNKPVTATDPCYDEGTWCTEVIDIEPGEYTCVAWIPVDEIVSVARCGIYRDGIISPIAHREHVGTIGVDGGLAGFYQDKPDYRDAEWKEFCDKLKKNEWEYLITEEGFCTSSGFGDGSYPVYAYKNKDGKAYALEIDFLDDIDEDEDDYYDDYDDEEDEEEN